MASTDLHPAAERQGAGGLDQTMKNRYNQVSQIAFGHSQTRVLLSTVRKVNQLGLMRCVLALCLFVTICAWAEGPLLQDTVSPNEFFFTQSDFYAREGATNASISVGFHPGSRSFSGSVSYATGDGTATAGSDYTAVNGTLSFSWSLGFTRTFQVPLINDTVYEGNETVLLRLVTAGNDILSRSNAVLHILDPESGTISFAQTGVIADETAGIARIQMVRTGGSRGSISIYCRTAEAWEGTTACASTDYIPFNQLITFAEGETTKEIELNVLDDNATNRERRVVLMLGGFDGATSGSNSTMSVSIVDGPLPQLKISGMSGGRLALQWPERCNCYALETSASSGAKGWSEVAELPFVTNGLWTVVHAPANASAFYRLRKR